MRSLTKLLQKLNHVWKRWLLDLSKEYLESILGRVWLVSEPR